MQGRSPERPWPTDTHVLGAARPPRGSPSGCDARCEARRAAPTGFRQGVDDGWYGWGAFERPNRSSDPFVETFNPGIAQHPAAKRRDHPPPFVPRSAGGMPARLHPVRTEAPVRRGAPVSVHRGGETACAALGAAQANGVRDGRAGVAGPAALLALDIRLPNGVRCLSTPCPYMLLAVKGKRT
jgi:hypothetical protein